MQPFVHYFRIAQDTIQRVHLFVAVVCFYGFHVFLVAQFGLVLDKLRDVTDYDDQHIVIA